jgi:hypothetical protein
VSVVSAELKPVIVKIMGDLGGVCAVIAPVVE